MNLRKFSESLTSNERKELLAILLEGPEHRVTVREWADSTHALPIRAKNALKHSVYADIYMDELSSQDLMKIRNLGIKTLRDIEKLYPHLR